MALICILKERNYGKPHLLDYNIEIFKEGNHF